MTPKQLLAALQKQPWGKSTEIRHSDEVNVHVNAEDLLTALQQLRDEKQFQFTQLMDITALDASGLVGYEETAETGGRYTVVYHLLSMAKNTRVRLRVRLWEAKEADKPTSVLTATGIFPNANWYERETWEMFGIVFDGHPDLRRLLTGYTFEGHPLKKDFPVMGHVEVFYDADKGTLVEKPVDMPQPTRSYKTEQEWDFSVS